MRAVLLVLLVLLAPTLAHATDGVALGHVLPMWSVAPFVVMLLAIAVLPLAVPHWWEHNANRALVAALLGVPVAIWIGTLDLMQLGHTAHEYDAFIILLRS